PPTPTLFPYTTLFRSWTRLRGGLPTVPVRDLVIHKRENDLVVGTFGRGIYVLDDYAPLRRETVPADVESTEEASSAPVAPQKSRSEEHTSELQSPYDL